MSRTGHTCETNLYWLNLWSDVTRDIDANKLIVFSSKSQPHVYIGVGYSEERKAIYAITNWDEVLMGWVPLSDAKTMYSINIY